MVWASGEEKSLAVYGSDRVTFPGIQQKKPDDPGGRRAFSAGQKDKPHSVLHFDWMHEPTPLKSLAPAAFDLAQPSKHA